MPEPTGAKRAHNRAGEQRSGAPTGQGRAPPGQREPRRSRGAIWAAITRHEIVWPRGNSPSRGVAPTTTPNQRPRMSQPSTRTSTPVLSQASTDVSLTSSTSVLTCPDVVPGVVISCLSMTHFKEETMLVHPVAVPGRGTLSWTVLGDDDVPVVPVDRFLAYLTVSAGRRTRSRRMPMTSRITGTSSACVAWTGGRLGWKMSGSSSPGCSFPRQGVRERSR